MAHLRSSGSHQPPTPIGVRSPITETEHLLSTGIAWKHGNPTPTDEEILTAFRVRNSNDPARCFEDYNRLSDETLDVAGGALHIIGGPPAEDETDIYVYSIPDSPLSIRIWPGGMTRYGQYCLEFYDAQADKTVNTPDGFAICGIAPGPGMPASLGMCQFQGPLVSWERAFDRRAPTLEGCEKYSVPEGSPLRLSARATKTFCS